MTDTVSLDPTVRTALRALEATELAALDPPRALILLATGLGLLPERLAGARRVELANVEGVPRPWSEATLVAGRLGSLDAWLLEDLSSDPIVGAGGGGPAWTATFPVWLAAAAGAHVLVHTSAGASLAAGAEPPPLAPGAFGVVRDHMNVSGSTPLLGLGESTLGPLFPDLTQLHHEGLRLSALERSRDLGLEAAEVVAGCTAGPSLETPSERRWLARAGADACVQGLAAPLLAAGHAGLSVLALVAIAESGEGPPRIRDVVARAAPAEAALEDLLVALSDDVARAAADLEEER